MRQEHVRVNATPDDGPPKKGTTTFIARITVPDKSVTAHGGRLRMAVALTSAIRAMGLRVVVTPED